MIILKKFIIILLVFALSFNSMAQSSVRKKTSFIDKLMGPFIIKDAYGGFWSTMAMSGIQAGLAISQAIPLNERIRNILNKVGIGITILSIIMIILAIIAERKKFIQGSPVFTPADKGKFMRDVQIRLLIAAVQAAINGLLVYTSHKTFKSLLQKKRCLCSLYYKLFGNQIIDSCKTDMVDKFKFLDKLGSNDNIFKSISSPELPLMKISQREKDLLDFLFSLVQMFSFNVVASASLKKDDSFLYKKITSTKNLKVCINKKGGFDFACNCRNQPEGCKRLDVRKLPKQLQNVHTKELLGMHNDIFSGRKTFSDLDYNRIAELKDKMEEYVHKIYTFVNDKLRDQGKKTLPSLDKLGNHGIKRLVNRLKKHPKYVKNFSKNIKTYSSGNVVSSIAKTYKRNLNHIATDNTGIPYKKNIVAQIPTTFKDPHKVSKRYKYRSLGVISNSSSIWETLSYRYLNELFSGQLGDPFLLAPESTTLTPK